MKNLSLAECWNSTESHTKPQKIHINTVCAINIRHSYYEMKLIMVKFVKLNWDPYAKMNTPVILSLNEHDSNMRASSEHSTLKITSRIHALFGWCLKATCYDVLNLPFRYQYDPGKSLGILVLIVVLKCLREWEQVPLACIAGCQIQWMVLTLKEQERKKPNIDVTCFSVPYI